MTRKRLTLVGLVAGCGAMCGVGTPARGEDDQRYQGRRHPEHDVGQRGDVGSYRDDRRRPRQSFQEVDLMGDWDGSEDNVADHSGKIDDLSATLTNPSQALTRVAMSEHTIANGFNEDIAYYGDSLGNVTVVSTTNLNDPSPTPTKFTINLPTVLNAFGNLNSDNVIVITGLAVEPAADLTSFANVNGIVRFVRRPGGRSPLRQFH